MITFFLAIVLFCVRAQGDIVIRQVNKGTTESWIVRGIATFEHDGSSPSKFGFQCTSTINDGQDLYWTKLTDGDMPTQQVRSDGVELLFDNPITAYAGTYACVDGASSDMAEIILTDNDPASLAEAGSLTYYAGETAVINIYASTLVPLTNNLISWTFNNAEIQNGTFSNSKTTLTIPNVQLSSTGVYELTITNHMQNSSASNTTLYILELPKFTTHPIDQTALVGELIELNCTATGSSLFISWYRVNGSLPTTSTTSNQTTGSTVTSKLTIADVTKNYSGMYYCNATTSDGQQYTTSDTAKLTVAVTECEDCPAGYSHVANNCSCYKTHICLTDNPCANGGKCNIIRDGDDSNYTCNCTSNYSGDNCTVCELQCGNDGTVNDKCVSCVCSPRYTGMLCDTEVDYCTDDINCGQYGSCVNDYEQLTYACSCNEGWTGSTCTECTVSNCEQCTGSPAVCEKCKEGYIISSDICVLPTDFYLGSTCNSTNNDSSYQCLCIEGWSGLNCTECADGYGRTNESMCIPCDIRNCQNCSSNYLSCFEDSVNGSQFTNKDSFLLIVLLISLSLQLIIKQYSPLQPG